MQWLPYKLKDGSNAGETIASDAGYCITRTRQVLRDVMEQDAPRRYLAWHGRSGDAHFKMLGYYDTAEEAKEACKTHFARSQEVAA
jgi:hypothetical protein